MARDPELPRFCGLFSRLGYTGQSCNVVPTKAVHIFVPSQHLIQKVLHFVCEFRESRTFWIPGFRLALAIASLAGMTTPLLFMLSISNIAPKCADQLHPNC